MALLLFSLMILFLLFTHIYALRVALYHKNLVYTVIIFLGFSILPAMCFYSINHTVLADQFMYSLFVHVFILIPLIVTKIRNNPQYTQAGPHFIFMYLRIYTAIFIISLIFFICFMPPEIRNDIYTHSFLILPDCPSDIPHFICANPSCPFYYYSPYVCCIISPLLAPLYSVVVIRILSYWNWTRKYVFNLFSII